MAKDNMQVLKQMTGEYLKMEKSLERSAKHVERIQQTQGKISAQAGGFAGSNAMSGSLGRISAGEIAGMGMYAASGLASAAFGALPSSANVFQRATGYYNAGVMQGAGNPIVSGAMGVGGRAGMYKRLADGLGKFGIQSPQATAELAQVYGMRGVTMGSGYESNLTKSVGGAAAYFNMDTNRAAAALEGLSAGAGGQSANLLRQMGIFTADPRTGAVKSPTELFREISGRLSAGRGKASATDVQDSFRRGNLGYFLKNSGLSEDQQQMFYLSELHKADTGKELDLSNSKQINAAMKGLEDKGLVNPQLELNRIAASEEGVLEAGTDSYVAGLKAAVPYIEDMNKMLGQAAASLGGFKAALEAATSTAGGSAGAGLIGGMVGGGMMIGAEMIGRRRGGGGSAADKAKPGAAPRAAATPASLASSAAKMKVPGIVGAITATVGAGLAISSGSGVGESIGTAIGTVAGGVLGGIAGGMTTFGLGGIAGAMLGSTAGGLAGAGIGRMFDGSGGSEYDARGGQTASSGASRTASGKEKSSRPNFVSPAKGKITSRFGPRKAPTKGASTNHKGVDIANSQGTPIVAAADGRVIFAGMNGSYGNHIKIKHRGGDYVTTYSHLNSITVKNKQQVVAGNKIGAMGSTGNSTGPHLHFEVLKNNAYVDPATVVPGLSGGSSTATVNNTQAESPETAGNKDTAAEGSVGSASGNSNGSSALAQALGFAASDFSMLGGVPSNVTPLVAITGQQTSSKNATDKSGKGGPTSVGMGITGGEPSLVGSNSGGSSTRGGVVINLSIKQASDSEARRFAKIVKDILEDDNNISKIGRG